MTQTTTDYLFQLSTPVSDRGFGAATTNNGAESFDDHLSQASTVPTDDSRKSGGIVPAYDAPAYRSTSSDKNTYSGDGSRTPVAPAATPQGNDDSSAAKAASPESGDAVHTATDKKPLTSDADAAERDAHKSDNAAASEAAGAVQAASAHSRPNDLKPSPHVEKSRAAVAAEKTADPTHERVPNGTASTQTNTASPSHAELQATEVGKEVVAQANNPSEANAATEKSGEVVTATKRGKESKIAALKSKSTGVEGNDGEASPTKSQAASAGNVELSNDGAKAATAEVQLSGTTDSKASKHAADNEDASDDDARHGSHSGSTTSVRNEAVAQAGKIDAAQLLNGGAAAINESPANMPLKNGKNDQATKPIAATRDSNAAALARLARTNTTMGRTVPDSAASDTPLIDPARFIGRVAKAFQTAQDRGGTLQLRLSPPELGSMRLELTVKDGVMSAALQTETDSARRLLLDHLPTLRDRLAEQNIRVDRFDVDVRRESTGGQADARGSHQQQFQNQSEQPTQRRQTVPAPTTREIARPNVELVGQNLSDAGLNLIV